MVTAQRDPYRAGAADAMHASDGDLYDHMQGANLYREAYKRGMSLTAFLDKENPKPKDEELDAFGRMLRHADIKITSDPENGYWADPFEKFYDDPRSIALVPEFTARVARKVRFGDPANQRLLYTGDQFAPGSVVRPYIDAAQARYFQMQPAIPLSEMVSITTPIEGDAYRAFYLTQDTTGASYRMYRVAEGSELPRARLTGGDHTIHLHKFGRALEATYEQLRRQRIDVIALHISRMALQAEIDKVAAVLDVMANGDGNSSTAATVYNLSSLDSNAVVGQLSLAGWLAFKLKFVNPYAVTTAIAQDNIVLQTYLLNTGTANIPLAVLDGGRGTYGGLTAINPGLADAVRIGHTTAAPANKIVAFDRRWSIERVTEVGGDITEVERLISRQTQLITLSEVEGYAIFDQAATKILNVNA